MRDSSADTKPGYPGVNLGSTSSQLGVNLGSTWGQLRVNLGAEWCRLGVNLGSTLRQLWVNLHRPTHRSGQRHAVKLIVTCAACALHPQRGAFVAELPQKRITTSVVSGAIFIQRLTPERRRSSGEIPRGRGSYSSNFKLNLSRFGQSAGGFVSSLWPAMSHLFREGTQRNRQKVLTLS